MFDFRKWSQNCVCVWMRRIKTRNTKRFFFIFWESRGNARNFYSCFVLIHSIYRFDFIYGDLIKENLTNKVFFGGYNVVLSLILAWIKFADVSMRHNLRVRILMVIFQKIIESQIFLRLSTNSVQYWCLEDCLELCYWKSGFTVWQENLKIQF